METLAILPAGLVERAIRVHRRSARRSNDNHIYKWFRVIEHRHGKAYARRLFLISRKRA